MKTINCVGLSLVSAARSYRYCSTHIVSSTQHLEQGECWWHKADSYIVLYALHKLFSMEAMTNMQPYIYTSRWPMSGAKTESAQTLQYEMVPLCPENPSSLSTQKYRVSEWGSKSRIHDRICVLIWFNTILVMRLSTLIYPTNHAGWFPRIQVAQCRCWSCWR